jgi:Zn finger protein HypA/HybF involved in hydrogenase expression
VATSLETRVHRLEDAAGSGGECPRCAGTTVIIVNNNVESVNRDGQKLGPEEAREFADEERDGRCPLCGQKRQEITVGSRGWGD